MVAVTGLSGFFGAFSVGSGGFYSAENSRQVS